MESVNIDELTAIVKFTFEGSFDSYEIYKKMPEVESEDEPVLLFKGSRGIVKYWYEFRYSQLHDLKKKGLLNEFLLRERDKVFKENN